jgi:hypothetical protein
MMKLRHCPLRTLNCQRSDDFMQEAVRATTALGAARKQVNVAGDRWVVVPTRNRSFDPSHRFLSSLLPQTKFDIFNTTSSPALRRHGCLKNLPYFTALGCEDGVPISAGLTRPCEAFRNPHIATSARPPLSITSRSTGHEPHLPTAQQLKQFNTVGSQRAESLHSARVPRTYFSDWYWQKANVYGQNGCMSSLGTSQMIWCLMFV